MRTTADYSLARIIRLVLLFFIFSVAFFAPLSRAFAQSNKDPKWVSGGFFDKEKISGDISAPKSSKSSGTAMKPPAPAASDTNQAVDSTTRSRVEDHGSMEKVTDMGSMQIVTKPDDRKSKRQNDEARDDVEDLPWARDRLEKNLELAKEQDDRAKRGKKEPTDDTSSDKHRGRREYVTRDSSSAMFGSRFSEDPLKLGKSTVSLIVAVEPERDYEKTVQEIVDLRNKKNVRIGEVIVVGGAKVEYQRALQMKEWAELALKESELLADRSPIGQMPIFKLNLPEFWKENILDKFGFAHFQDVNMDGLLVKYDVANSPAWIVNYEGVNYVLEGPNSIYTYFDKSGEFTPAAEANRSLARDGSSNITPPKSPDELVGQSMLVTNSDPTIKLPSSASRNLFKIRSSSERVYRYGADL